MKNKKQKYWLCEFMTRSGEDEYYDRYIYSDKNLKDMGYEDDKDDYKILSQFFLQKITPKNFEGWKGTYWKNCYTKLVSFNSMKEVKPRQFKTLNLAGVYVNPDKLMFNYKKGKQQ
jgi:hypothetical protein|tara:strand:- start:156 stop:503 length:348 start_codon:yes stop_codon:yes gene_type:complete